MVERFFRCVTLRWSDLRFSEATEPGEIVTPILNYYDSKPAAYRYDASEMDQWRRRARQFWEVFQQVSSQVDRSQIQKADDFAAVISENPIRGNKLALLLETVWVSSIKQSLKKKSNGQYDLSTETVKSFMLLSTSINTSLQNQPQRAADFAHQLFTENEIPLQLRCIILNIPYTDPKETKS